jgi:hypothetical protein
MIQLQLIEVGVEDVVLKAPPATIYLVAAFSRNGMYWKIHRETQDQEHASYDGAKAHAEKLSAQWTDRKIIKVEMT